MAFMTFYEEPIGLSVAQGALIRWQKGTNDLLGLAVCGPYKANTSCRLLKPIVGGNFV